MEIGCGVGLHPIRWAQENTHKQILAFERTHLKFEKFQRRLVHHKLKNISAVQGDGIAWMIHALPSDSVEKLFLLYPNPYPKEAQANKRFHRMPAFFGVLEKLQREAEIVLATNCEFYAREAEKYFVGHWRLSLRERKILPKDFVPRSHFEKKYLDRGEICWNLVFQKT